jgi:hypothetical protein
MENTVIKGKLSDKEKNDLLKEILGNEYSASNKNLPVLKKSIDLISDIDTAFTFAELIPAINTVLAGSRVLSVVSSGVSIFSVFLFPVAAMIDIIDAYQVGHRMYALRSIAYTVTAWAYGKPVPASSMRILSNIREGKVVVKQRIVNEYKQLWAKTSRDVLNKLNMQSGTDALPKEAMQIALRAISENDPKVLCEMLLKGFEDKLSNIERITWKSNYSIKYPS